MERIILKNSDLEVSRFCFGGCPMGGYGWGKVSREDIIKAVNVAVDKGINFFDTADTYGLGESERTLAQALGNKRKKTIVATKFGVRIENGKTFYDNSRAWIEKACYESLKRMNTDYIDLYQVHYRDETPIQDVIESLQRLKDKGYIRYFGLSNIHENDIDEIARFKGSFVTFQDEFSLACRKNEKDMLTISDKLDLTPLTWGSLGQGILTGKYDKGVQFSKDDRRARDIYINFHGEKLLHNLAIVEELKKIAAQNNRSVAAVAIRWILDYLKGSVVIAGIKNESQLTSNLEALNWRLSDVELNILEKISNWK